MSKGIDWSQYLEQATQHFEWQRRRAIDFTANTLTERIAVRSHDDHYRLLDKLSHQANDLFNVVTYHYRQSFFHHKSVNYNKMEKLPAELYRSRQDSFPTLGYVQAICQQVKERFIDFDKQNLAYRQNPADFMKHPRLPHYRKKGHRSTFMIDEADLRTQDDRIIVLGLDRLSVKVRRQINEISQVRIVPRDDIFFIEVVYHTTPEQKFLSDNQRYLSIDPGLNNAFTLASNVPRLRPVIINGRPLKSFNHQWNQRVNQIKAKHAQCKQPTMSKRLQRLQRDRYLKIERFAHASSRYIIRYAQENDLNTIIIGDNRSRRDLNYRSQSIRDNFIELPYQTFLKKIIYKGARVGIPVLVVKESYTSQTSFLDHERPIWDNGDTARRKNHLSPISRRLHRGLFKSNQYKLINADVNGSLQILRRAVPNAFADGISGIGLSPVKHNVNF